MATVIMAYIQNGLSKVDDQQFQDKFESLKSNRLRKIAMTLTEKYIEDGIDKGVLFGAIRQCQQLLGKEVSSTENLRNLTDRELQVLHDELETEVRQKLRS